MKKYIKVALYLVGVLSIAFVIDRIVGISVEKLLLPRQNDKYMYAYQGGKGEEVVILGASRAAHHYVPKIIEDSLGVKCFNYGCDGQNIYNQYAVLNLLLNHAETKPKLVILELSSIDILDSPSWNTEKLSVLHSYYSIDDTLRTVVNLQGKEVQYALKTSKLYSFNSNVHNLLKPVFGLNRSENMNAGFSPLYKKWDKQIEPKIVDGGEMDTNKVVYLNKFIEKCQRDSIQVIVFNSPNYVNLVGECKWKPIIKDITKGNNIQFWDFEQEQKFLCDKNLFNEPFHLNSEGARLYTNEVIPLIRDALQ